jgi:hypothetical protein
VFSNKERTVAKIPAGVGPRFPQVVVLVGATGDLSRRKLIPGLLHLASAGFIPACRIIGVSLDAFDAAGFRKFARAAHDEFSVRKVDDAGWGAFAECLDYVPLQAGAAALAQAVARAEQAIGTESRRLHYLAVPPSAALSAVRMLGDAHLVKNSRIVMEKPFGTDLASAKELNAKLHEVFNEEQIFRIDHFPRQGARAEHPRVPVRQRAVRAHLESQLHRPRADRRAGNHRARAAQRVLRIHRRVPRHGGHAPVPDPGRSWPWSRPPASHPSPSARRNTRCFAACCRCSPRTWCAGSTTATAARRASRRNPRPRRSSR